MHHGPGASPSIPTNSTWSLWDYWNSIKSALGSCCRRPSRLPPSPAAAAVANALRTPDSVFAAAPSITAAGSEARASLLAPPVPASAEDEPDVEAGNPLAASAGAGFAPAMPTTASCPSALNITNFAVGGAVIAGIFCAGLALLIYFINSLHSSRADFPTSAGFQALEIYTAASAAIINAILFFQIGKDIWTKWPKLSWGQIGLRLFYMTLSVLPSLIMFAAIFESTCGLGLPKGMAYTLAGSMTFLRDLLNATAIEGFIGLPADGLPNKILLALSYRHDRGERLHLARAGLLVCLALFYTITEHSKATEALTFITRAFPQIFPDYSQVGLANQYTVEILSLLPLAPLNITWALAGMITNKQVSLISLEIFKTLARSVCAVGDLSISGIDSLFHRDTRQIAAAWQRSGENFTDGTLAILVLSSGFAAVALAMRSTTASSGSTTFDWEGTVVAQKLIQFNAYITGTEMNFSSTWRWLKGEKLEILKFKTLQLIKEELYPLADRAATLSAIRRSNGYDEKQAKRILNERMDKAALAELERRIAAEIRRQQAAAAAANEVPASTTAIPAPSTTHSSGSTPLYATATGGAGVSRGASAGGTGIQLSGMRRVEGSARTTRLSTATLHAV